MTFALDIQNFVDRVRGRSDTISKKIVFGVLRGVVRKSPVDTGRFRGNWQVGVGVVPEGELETTDASGRGTEARGLAQIPPDAAGRVYYVVNNLPYAVALEEGHSPQTPPGGIVAATVAQFDNLVRDVASE